MEIEAQMFERSEFLRFPFFALHNREPRRGSEMRSPFLGYLFWRSKKGN